MQYRKGSDVEAVLASAKRLDTYAAEVAGVTSAVGAATTRISAAWGGSDASDFVEHWRSRVAPQLDRLKGDLSRMAVTARRNMPAQRAASSGSGSSASAFSGATASVSTTAGAGGTASAQPSSSYSQGLRGQAGRPEDKELWKLA